MFCFLKYTSCLKQAKAFQDDLVLSLEGENDLFGHLQRATAVQDFMHVVNYHVLACTGPTCQEFTAGGSALGAV